MIEVEAQYTPGIVFEWQSCREKNVLTFGQYHGYIFFLFFLCVKINSAVDIFPSLSM